MSERKLGKDAADAQVVELLEYYEIEADEGDDVQEGAINDMINLLSPFFQKGRIELCKDGGFFVVQNINGGEPLKYKEIDGSAKMEMDKAAKRGEHAKMYSLLGYLSGQGEAVISKLKSKDLSTAEALAQVFLHV